MPEPIIIYHAGPEGGNSRTVEEDEARRIAGSPDAAPEILVRETMTGEESVLHLWQRDRDSPSLRGLWIEIDRLPWLDREDAPDGFYG